MAWSFALVIDPVPCDDEREDFTDTLTPIDPAAPALSIGELSTQRGDGVFESIGVIDGHAQEVAAHLERLAHSARLCELPIPNAQQWRQAVAHVAAKAQPGESVLKLLLSRGVEHGPSPTAWVTLAPAADNARARTEGLAVASLDRGYGVRAGQDAPWLLLGAKTLSYAVNMAAVREAKRRGADDAVFVSSDGYLLEGPTSSVLLRIGDTFVTPEPGAGILHGTTQLSVFEYLEQHGHRTQYRLVGADELAKADAAWLLSSIRLAAPITTVDGVGIPVDRDLTAALNAYLLSPRD